METFVPEDTPLGVILEGEGQNDTIVPSSDHVDDGYITSTNHSIGNFAPHVIGSLQTILHGPLMSQLVDKLSKYRIKTSLSRKTIGGEAWASTAETESHFFEHFRYVIIASQLLEENTDFGTLRASSASDDKDFGNNRRRGVNNFTFGGAVLTAVLAFLVVSLINWAKSDGLRHNRLGVLICLCIMFVCVGYLGFRLHRRSHGRNRALQALSKLLDEMQILEIATTTALSVIQDVELVARGYKISTPLPPISRLDDVKAVRRCMAMRKQLSQTYISLDKALGRARLKLQHSIDIDDFTRYMEVYDVPKEAVEELILGGSRSNEDDSESLGVLRHFGYHTTCMRRAFLCSLLSLSNHRDDNRWQAIANVCDELNVSIIPKTKSLSQTLQELEDFTNTASVKATTNHANDRLRAQVRKLTNLSSGIRSLQAKMTLLREESNAALARADDLTDLGPSLRTHYESIGQDIQSLVQDWETGRSILSQSISKHERRISVASSSGILSPRMSTHAPLSPNGDSPFHNHLLSRLHHSHQIERERSGTPTDALRLLTSTTPSPSSSITSPDEEPFKPTRDVCLSPQTYSMPSTPISPDLPVPSLEPLSPRNESVVFEGLSIPKSLKRSSLTRDERIKAMHEERLRAEERREARERGGDMLRELKSVIFLRNDEETTSKPLNDIGTNDDREEVKVGRLRMSSF